MGTGMCKVSDWEHAIQFTGRPFDYYTIATEMWSLKNLNGTSKSCISVSSSPFLKCTFLVTESCVIKSINKTTECYSIYSHKNTVIKQKLSISEKAICYKLKLKGRRSRGTKSYFSLFFVAIVWSFHDLLLMRSRCDNSLWHNIELFTLYM